MIRPLNSPLVTRKGEGVEYDKEAVTRVLILIVVFLLTGLFTLIPRVMLLDARYDSISFFGDWFWYLLCIISTSLICLYFAHCVKNQEDIVNNIPFARYLYYVFYYFIAMQIAGSFTTKAWWGFAPIPLLGLFVLIQWTLSKRENVPTKNSSKFSSKSENVDRKKISQTRAASKRNNSAKQHSQ